MSRQNDVGHVLSRAPVLEAASRQWLMALQKACLRHRLLVETAWSPVSQTDPPLFARYIARSRRWWEESVMSSSRRRNRYSKVSVCPIAMIKC